MLSHFVSVYHVFPTQDCFAVDFWRRLKSLPIPQFFNSTWGAKSPVGSQMKQYQGWLWMESRGGERPGEQPTMEGNMLLLAWPAWPLAEPCWPAIQTATPQEPWHSVSLPTKQTQSETASIFLKSQLYLPPGVETACLCASPIRAVNFLPAVGRGCNPPGLPGYPTCSHDKGKSWSPP